MCLDSKGLYFWKPKFKILSNLNVHYSHKTLELLELEGTLEVS